MSREGGWRSQENGAEAETVLANLFLTEGVRISPRLLRMSLETQPSFPSLGALVGCLEELDVPHLALSLPFEKFSQIGPAVVHLRSGTLVLVLGASHESVEWVSSSGAVETISRRQFETLWSGVALFFREELTTLELPRVTHLVAAEKKRRLGWWAVGAFFLASGLALSLSGPAPVRMAVFLLANLIALATSASLVLVHLGHSSVVSEFLCPAVPSSSGCQAALNSKLGSVAGVPLADIGSVYFAGQFIAIVASHHSGPTPLLLALSLAATPVIVFSVLYQGLVLRTWCKLCLLVQSALAAQAIVAVVSLEHLGHWQFLPNAATLVCFAMPSVLWWMGKELVVNALALPATKRELRRLRRDPRVTRALLQGAPEMPFPPLPGDIVLGTPDGPLAIGVVLSLECRHCEQALLSLRELIEHHNDKLRARVRLVASPEHTPGYQAALVATNFALAGEQRKAVSLLLSYYRSKEAGDEQVASEAEAALANAQTWAEGSGIQATPAIMVQGKELPRELTLTDLRSWIETVPR